MQLPSNAIILVIIALAVIASIAAFFFSSSGGSLSRTEANRIFSTDCAVYSQRACDWKVTYEPEFQKYLGACRTIFGEEKDSYSCLYTHCKGCYETADLKCSGFCNICSGHEAASIDRKNCCAQYDSECAGSSYACDACPG